MIKLKSLLNENVINTPEFKRWFGNSRVVDKHGNPMMVFHGTSSDNNFTAFRKKQSGIWFAKNSENAHPGNASSENRIIPAYLSLQNPYKLNNDELKTWRASTNPLKIIANMRSQLINKGYDGVDIGDYAYVAFYPEQIKSAIGNCGKFDPNDPDITKEYTVK